MEHKEGLLLGNVSSTSAAGGGGGKKHVINRHGIRVPLQFDRITDRLTSLLGNQSAETPESGPLYESLDPASITQEIARGIPDGMTTAEIDTMVAQACHFASTRHPDYDRLASRLVASNNHKQMQLSFSQHVAELHARGLVRDAANAYVQEHHQVLDATIQSHRDALFSYFGWKTLRRSYLHKIPTGKKNDQGEPIMKVHDTPQFLWMRVALEVSYVPSEALSDPSVLLKGTNHPVAQLPPEWQSVHAGLVQQVLEAGNEEEKAASSSLDPEAVAREMAAMINKLLLAQQQDEEQKRAIKGIVKQREPEKTWSWGQPDINLVVANYHALSRMWFTHASPTLFHSLMKRNGLSSCFLLPPCADALTVGDFSIYQFLAKCAAISAVAGGIGWNASGVRCTGRPILGSNGTSNGLIPMLRVFNASACYVDQGGQKRPGAIAIYLEPWHGDIEEFLAMKAPEGEDKKKCFDLHYGLWIPDEFMRRVEKGEMWSLMSPDECPGLVDTYGAEFDALYKRYEREGKVLRQIPAITLWRAIIQAQPSTGSPYMLSKDASNRKSNQKNLGTIKSSNLCVAPETLILIENEGHVPIAAVAKRAQPSRVWNGEQFSSVHVRQTNAEPTGLLTITTTQGVTVDVTPYHLCPVVLEERIVMLPANQLKAGMRLQAITQWPQVPPLPAKAKEEEKGNEKSTAFSLDVLHTAGYMAGESALWIHTTKPNFAVADWAGTSRLDIIPDEASWQDAQSVPFHLQDQRSAMLWFSGLCESHGSLIVVDPLAATLAPMNPNSDATLSVPTLYPAVAQQWGLFLQQCLGIFDWQIEEDIMVQSKRSSELPARLFGTFDLKIGYVGVRKLVSLGFDVHNVEGSLYVDDSHESKAIAALMSPAAASQAIEAEEQGALPAPPQVIIQSVQDHGRKDMTYCFDEPLRHLATFNGILLGNCTEILEYTSPDEIAVCNLASYSVPTVLRRDEEFPKAQDEDEDVDGFFAPPKLSPEGRAQLLRKYPSNPNVQADLMLVYRTVSRMTRNLNRVIDVGFYPVPQAENSNRRHRPIGVGLQGLADLFIKMRLPFTSPEAIELNEAIAATMYYAACRTSMLLAKRDGPYSTFHYNGGCPMSKGEFQFDMWDDRGPTKNLPWAWETLRAEIIQYGVRNSLTVSPMPTAGTSQLLDNNEAFYPPLHLYYTRNTAAGKFPIIQRQLLLDLLSLGKWDMKMKQRLIAAGGTIQPIPGLPPWMYEVYRVWDEQPRDKLLEMCYQRARYVDQGQSMNIRQPAEKNLLDKLTNYYFKCWKLGMKNWSYYFKSSAPMEANRSTVDAELLLETNSGSRNATALINPAPYNGPIDPIYLGRGDPINLGGDDAAVVVKQPQQQQLDIPGPLHLSPSPSMAYSSGSPLDAVIDAAVGQAAAETSEDDLHRLTADMALLKAACLDEEDVGSQKRKKQQQTAAATVRRSSKPCVDSCGA